MVNIFTEPYITSFKEIYYRYNNIIKPLLAEVEASYEVHPLQISNEIRAMNDHIARCYLPHATAEQIQKDLEKANSHVSRIILDCFKFLNVYYHTEYVESFRKKTTATDLTVLNNGLFIRDYERIRIEARAYVVHAKKSEAVDKDTSLKNYELAFHKYKELEHLVESHQSAINWATTMFYIGKGRAVAIFIVGAIISAFIGAVVTSPTLYDKILSILPSLSFPFSFF